MDVTHLDVEFDASVNALYVRLEQGTVAQTIEVSPSVLVDVSATGSTLGYEFINADRFLPFLREHAGALPPIEAWTQPEPQRVAI